MTNPLSEYRIGNLIQMTPGLIGRVIKLEFDPLNNEFCLRCCNGGNCRDFKIGKGWELIKNIPLTEECLIKLGFKKDPMNPRIYNNSIGIYTSDEGLFFLNEYSEFGEEIESQGLLITTIHQLQNIYYVLIGTELEIDIKIISYIYTSK